MTRHLHRVLRLLEKLAEKDPQSMTPQCPCPTWGEWADILAAAALTASNTPNGALVGRVLAVLSAIAGKIARDSAN